MDANTRRLQRLTRAVAAVPEGKALLQLARKLRCPVLFGNLPDNDMIAGLCCAPRPDGGFSYRIHLNEKTTDAQLILKLAHELRHLWQFSLYPPEKSLRLSVPMRLLHQRVLEGDAFAFETFFDKARRTGLRPADFDWKGAFDRFQQSNLAVAYDATGVLAAAGNADALRRAFAQAVAAGETPPPLAHFFNKAALSDLFGVETILRAGVGAKAPPYAADGGDTLLRAVRAEADPREMRRARQLNQAVLRISRAAKRPRAP
jgi:hypothetical protein